MEKGLHDLIQNIKNKKQTILFLGTGVDYSFDKKMLWNDILSVFIKNSLPLLNLPPNDIKELQDSLDIQSKNYNNSTEFSTESKISVIKKLLGDNYVPLLQSIIYSQGNQEDLVRGCEAYVRKGSSIDNTTFYTLFAVAELILKHDNIKAVVTYNFDNLLTQAIHLLRQKSDYFKGKGEYLRLDKDAFHPIDVYSGWTDEPYVNASFLIYHPHGYIQPPGYLIPNERNQVVMSMEEFYDSAKEVFSWQTATQIHFLTHYMCIYLGASLTDMNMQRMLSFADIEHNNESVYYLTRKGNAQSRLKSIFHTANHLKVIAADSYQDLYNELLNDNNYVSQRD